MGLKELYYKLEDKYYAFINWLAANGLDLKPLVSAIESHGIPSLPLFVAIILIAAGAAFLYLNPGGLAIPGLTQAQALTVNVQAAGAPVDGAVVTLTGQGINQSAATINGVASFAGIAQGLHLRVSVSKEGFRTITRDIIAGGAVGPFLLQGGREQVTVLVVDEDGTPVGNAQVSYLLNGETRNTVADSHGTAKLSAAIGVEIALTVTAQGFDIYRDSFTPDSAGYQQQVTLQRSAGRIDSFNSLRAGARRIPSPNDDSQESGSRSVNLASSTSVEVSVVNSSGAAVQGVEVSLFNAADSAVLGSGSTGSDGKFTFQDISTGIQAYVGADAAYYVVSRTAPKVINQGVKFNVTLATPTNESAANLTVVFTDDTGARVPTAGLQVFMVDSATHTVYGSGPQRVNRNGNLSNQFPAGVEVYLSVYGRDYVRFASEAFTLTAGQNEFSATLAKKTADNSASATVNLQDFYTQPVLGGSVTAALSSNGHLLLPQVSASGGSAEFTNLPLELVTFTATNTTFTGTAELRVSAAPGNNTASIKMLPVSGTVKIRAVDLFSATQENVEQAQFAVYYLQGRDLVPIAGCRPTEVRNGFCTLSLASGVTFTLVTSAPGFLNKTQTFVLEPSTELEVVASLISAANDKVVQPQGFKLLKTDGSEVGADASLQEGEIYFAAFDVVVPSHATQFGFYARIDSPQTSSNDNAVLLKGFPIDDTYNINSGQFNLTGSGSFAANSCGEAIASNAVGTFKWIEATLPSEGFAALGLTPDSEAAQTVSVKIPLLITRAKPRNVTLAFRAFAVVGDSYIRSPVDADLGTGRESRAKRSCAASTFANNYKVVAAASKIVQCGAQACLFLSFEQGGRFGAEGFEVKPAIGGGAELPSPLLLHYSVLDFNPNFDDGTTLTFTTDKKFLNLLRKADQPLPTPADVDYAVNIADNSYTAVTKTAGRVDGAIKVNPSLERANPFPVTLSFGNKIAVATSVNLVGLPQPSTTFAPLPQHYVLQYSGAAGGAGAGASDSLKLLEVNGTGSAEVNEVNFRVDPIFPADALLLVFNFSSAPCQDLTFSLEDGSACFEQVQNPQQVLSLPEEYQTYGDKLLLLKYDASTDRCSAYSKNPNKLKEATAKLRVASTCTGTARELNLVARPNPDLVEGDGKFKPPYRAVFSVPKAWSEDAVPDLGVENSFVHVLVNNRQYSRDNFVRMFSGDDEEGAQDFRVADNAVVLPVRGIRAFASLDEDFAFNLLGVEPFPEELSVATRKTVVQEGQEPREVIFENPAESMPSTRSTAISVLANTVYRRRQDCNPPGRPCPFAMFPYSAFVADAVTKPVQLHLGGELWSGGVGDGKVDFDFAGLQGEKCSVRNEEGVYDYYWEYSIRPEDGNAVQIAHYAPLQLDVLDYADQSCSRSQQLCGKLSFSGGQCLNNCGDGWYNGVAQGTQGKLCDGHEFKLDDIRPRGAGGLWKGWLQNIPNAAFGCFVSEVGGAISGCAVGSVGGPLGRFVGTQAGGEVAGVAYDLTLGDVIAHGTATALNLKRKEGDLPGFSHTLSKWAQYCSYAGIAEDAVNAYQIIKDAAGASNVAETQCPSLAVAAERAAAKCFCYTGSTPQILTSGGAPGFEGGCFIEKALRTLATDTAVTDAGHTLTGQFSRADVAFADYTDAQKRLEQARSRAVIRQGGQEVNLCAGSLCQDAESAQGGIALYGQQIGNNPPNPEAVAKLQTVQDRLEETHEAKLQKDNMVAELRASGFCKDQNSKECRDNIAKANAQIGTLDSVYALACGKAFTVATALLAVEGVAAETYADERAYVQVNKAGHTNFNSGVLGIGGGPDVDCEDNTDFEHNADAWLDFDFSSLRIFNKKTTHCMDRRNIAAYGANGGVNFDTGLATFYISSRG